VRIQHERHQVVTLPSCHPGVGASTKLGRNANVQSSSARVAKTANRPLHPTAFGLGSAAALAYPKRHHTHETDCIYPFIFSFRVRPTALSEFSYISLK
jgi:hypothetical protein